MFKVMQLGMPSIAIALKDCRTVQWLKYWKLRGGKHQPASLTYLHADRLDSYSTANVTILYGNDQQGLYTICVEHEHNGAKVKDMIVHKYEHQFSMKELLLEYLAKQEDTII
jgi:hypothetical protein